VDSTLYRIPSKATVQGWAKKTPTTIEMFRGLWNAARRPDRSPTSIAVSGNLFEWNIKDALKLGGEFYGKVTADVIGEGVKRWERFRIGYNPSRNHDS
jgi:hypothetical protein